MDNWQMFIANWIRSFTQEASTYLDDFRCEAGIVPSIHEEVKQYHILRVGNWGLKTHESESSISTASLVKDQ